MATQPDVQTQPISNDDEGSADPYWLAEQNQRTWQLTTELREHAFHAALHPALRGLDDLRSSVDEVLADAAKILAFFVAGGK